MRTVDIGYVAGIVDGEGCILLHRGRYPHVRVSMTDEDVILRCQEITNLGHVLGPYPSTSGTKPYWLWQVSTSSEAAALIMTLYPLLSHRRQERARDVLEVWRGRRVPGKAACGNMAGYGRHIKDVTPVCDPCAEASRFYHRERRARLRAAKEVA